MMVDDIIDKVKKNIFAPSKEEKRKHLLKAMEQSMQNSPSTIKYVKNLEHIPFAEAVTDPKFKAKNIQIGGEHYKKMAIQPGEFITKNGLGWYEGNAVKYICRHKMKGGKQDLEKAIHYLQLAIQDFYDV
jgi:hypothetical protein